MPLKVFSKPSIELFLRTTQPFHSKKVAKDFFNLILSYGSYYRPFKYGTSEPIRKIFDEREIDEAILDWFYGRNLTQEQMESEYCQGSLLMKGRPPAKLTYDVSWSNWSKNGRFNCINVGISRPFLEKNEEEMNHFINFCNDLVCMFSPAHTEVYDLVGSIPCTLTRNALIPDNLTIRCPSLKWRTYFGPPYIEMLGKETILNAPCWKTEEVGDTIVLQLTESVFEEIPQMLRQSIVDYFEASVDPTIRENLGEGFIFRPFYVSENYNRNKKLVPTFLFREYFGRNLDDEKMTLLFIQRPLKKDVKDEQ